MDPAKRIQPVQQLAQKLHLRIAAVRPCLLGNVDRCVTLDNAGVLILWNTSRLYPIDKEERLIDSTIFQEDKIKSFDVFRSVGPKFTTINGLIVCAAGKRQHVYRVIDVSRRISPPIRYF
jgi:hypothetical protein